MSLSPIFRAIAAVYQSVTARDPGSRRDPLTCLGEAAVEEGYAWRFLLDVALGVTRLPPEIVTPALAVVAGRDPARLQKVLLRGHPTASPVAAEAFGLQPARFGELLSPAVSHPDPMIRLAATAGLAAAAAQGGEQAVVLLGAGLQDRDPRVAWAAAAALGEARGRGCANHALSLLQEAITSGDETMLGGVAAGLARLWPARKRGVVAVLRECAAQSSAGLRAALLAARHLPYSGGRSLVLPAAHHSASDIRALAAAALGQWAPTVPMAARSLHRLTRDSHPTVRAACTSGLAMSGDVDALRTLSTDRSALVRAATAHALALLLSVRVTELLSQLSQDRAASVRAAARQASIPAAASPGEQQELTPADIWAGEWGEEVAAAMARLAKSAACWRTVELARTLRRVLVEEGDPAIALHDAAEALAASKLSPAAETLRWMAAAMACQEIKAVGQLSQGAPTRSAAAAALARAGRELGRVGASRPRARASTRAHLSLDAVMQDPSGQLAWLLAKQVARRWRTLAEAITNEMSPITITLLSRVVVVGPEATALVRVENRGRIPAHAVQLVLPAGSKPVSLPELPPAAEREVAAPLGSCEAGWRRLQGEGTFLLGGNPGSVSFSGALTAVQPPALGAVANPFVVGKPLPFGSQAFFGRDAELSEIERSLNSGSQGAVVILTGERRTGKTSILRQLEGRLAATTRPVFFDVQGALSFDPNGFFRELSAGLNPGSGGWLRDGGEAWPDGLVMLQEEAAASSKPVVLLLDEFDELTERVRMGVIDPAVLARFRSLLQHTPNLRMVLCGTPRLEALAGEHWSFLLNLATYQRVGCLTVEAAERALREPLSRLGMVCEDTAIAQALALTGAHPYLTQLLGYRVVEECVERGVGGVWLATVARAAGQVIECGDMHLRYLWEAAGEEGQAVLRALVAGGERLDLAALQPRRPVYLPEHGGEQLCRLEITERRGTDLLLRIGLLAYWVQERHL